MSKSHQEVQRRKQEAHDKLVSAIDAQWRFGPEGLYAGAAGRKQPARWRLILKEVAAARREFVALSYKVQNG